MRFGKVQTEAGIRGLGNQRRRIGLTVTCLGAVGLALCRGMAGHPADLIGQQGMRLKQRMVMALHHAQNVLVHFLARHKPGRMVACATGGALFLDAADAQTRTLAQRIEGQAHMLAQLAVAVVQDETRLLADIAVQKVAERALSDEADARRVLLPGVGQADLFGNATHLGLVQLAHGEHGLGQLGLVQAVQEIALILAVIQALEQLEQLGGRILAHACIVAGGDLFCSQAHGVVQKSLELDLRIAQHVRIGRATGLVLAQELGKHAVLVVCGKVHMLDLDADHVGHGRRIDKVDIRRAVLAVVVIFPVLHEDADDLVALLFEKIGGDGGIHTARQTHHDTLLVAHRYAIIPAPVNCCGREDLPWNCASCATLYELLNWAP